ncbi:hypothetical protein P154DRAFT_484560 [Amniculicola lignicola CBS 123094]|uniref:Cyclin-dependent kinase n=1 Tax=Amniculicola lignicola CBS 123094 TaxID=1392246 RepID=A0A6A5WZS9_9PLEO|nr:hypothetical protein P154DRAFT_484560 [Amniculicola lignicola CBS 123094]
MLKGHAGAVGGVDNNISAHHPTNIPKLYKRELPDSQESYISTVSSASFVPPLHPSSSNISNATVPETVFNSPSTSNAASSQSQPLDRAMPPSPSQARGQHAVSTAPRLDTANAQRTGDTAASPMAVDSPVLAPGSKRTADGSVKGAVPAIENTKIITKGHKRTKSDNPRIGELSAQLKTRLSYAMVKVQNGWEKQSLEELEDRTSQHGSPMSVPGPNGGSQFDSPIIENRGRRPSGVSINSDQVMLSPGQGSPQDVPKATGAVPSSFWRSRPQPLGTGSANAMSAPSNGPVLAPAAEIGARRKRRSSASFAPPPLLGSGQRKYYSDLGGAPRTPTAVPRPGILRMPSQQAEKDAVDTLLFMSSPNNSGRIPHNSMDAPQPSPLRSEIPRRVMFENQPHINGGHSQRQPAGPHKGAYFQPDPSHR